MHGRGVGPRVRNRRVFASKVHDGKHRYWFNNDWMEVLRSSPCSSSFQQLTEHGGVGRIRPKTGGVVSGKAGEGLRIKATNGETLNYVH